MMSSENEQSIADNVREKADNPPAFASPPLESIDEHEQQQTEPDDGTRLSTDKPNTSFGPTLVGESDNMSKPSEKRAHRHQPLDTTLMGRAIVWMVFFTTIILLTFLVPYWIIGIHPHSENTMTVTSPNTPVHSDAQNRMDDIKFVILQNAITSSSDMQDRTSPAYQALRWMAESDPAQVEPQVNHHDNTELLQRYAMAVLYFATHPTNHNMQHLDGHAANGSQLEELEQEAHVSSRTRTTPTDQQHSSLVNHMTKPEERDEGRQKQVVEVNRHDQRRSTQIVDGKWTREDRWMTSLAVCDWGGIKCETIGPHKVIREVNLTSNALQGTLPSELQALTQLTMLDLSSNQLSGELPAVLFRRLHLLRSFIVGNNHFMGTIPTEIASLKQMQELDLSRGSFQGTIPIEIAKMTQLQILILEENQLEQAIPNLASLSELRILRLGNNRFAPSDIPYHISLLRNLEDLGLQHNSLKGTFLTELENLHSIQKMDLSFNNLENPLPDVFQRFPDLKFLNLEHNDFSSTLPDSIGHLQQLTSLVLSFNKFEGFLPRAWTDMQSLRYLLLDHNRLEGTLSMKMFGQMPMLETFQLDYNSMTGSLPKQLGGMTRLGNLTLIGNSFVGSMPSQLCELKEIGSLETLTADCGLVTCGCCDNCANKLS